DVDELRRRFAVVADELAADHAHVADTAVRKRVVLLVSKQGHCLYDLLSRWHAGDLSADIRLVIGNHDTLAGVAEMFGVPFAHVPVPADEPGKRAAFARIAELADAERPDVLVLA